MAAETQARPKAEIFELKAPLLSLGRDNWPMVRTDLMSLTLKVYAEGGENAMHYHTNEEHAFIVLQGEATFHLDSEENAQVVHQWQGVFLPKGAQYYFQSSGNENLVLLRVGAPGNRAGGDGRLDPTGNLLIGHSEANKHIDGVAIEGKFFGRRV